MTVKLLDRLDGDLADQLWPIYLECFSKVRTRAANRHVMYRTEFDEVMADERVTKFVPLDDGGVPVGLGTLGNQLDAFPLIAPEYFQANWPEPYAQRRIYYCGFVGVVEHARMTAAFREIFTEFHRITEPVRGLVALDICTFNEQVLGLPQHIDRALRRASRGRSTCDRIDAQSFWLYDVTGALGEKVPA